ncbi:RNA-binding cell elongation regulator Jag/EloR [Caryophanon tenue]|uniref:RNA-binding protein KhpB n=1 Tax=Caryophanon tenue TaxID=33978 RepID=A0A1C0YL79_9BACL|nr:RNA-binding cell elongation regulator Jag/EloR [Caryophanon tenue]OCS87901.1 protein jag [Caryophanon tenue]
MKQTTQIGATSEEAIELALKKLGKTREQVEIQVLQEGKKGFLGIGARSAHVIVRVKEEPIPEPQPVVVEMPQPQIIPEPVIEAITEEEPVIEQTIEVENVTISEEPVQVDVVEVTRHYLQQVAEAMDILDLDVDIHKKGKTLYVNLSSKKAALLIGKRGQTLNALQQLTQLVVNKDSQQYVTVLIDVENYRDRREEALELLASRMAEKAVRTGKRVAFEPMPSYERKVIHHVLSKRVDIETYSEGAEPNRYLVIQPTK